MIRLKDVTVSILGESLFEDVSFVLNRGDKVGLVGPNGSGKSTLLKVILNEVEIDNGTVTVEREQLGYLPQEVLTDKLSGGEKMKKAILELLDKKPSSLLLDEPTNNLDFESVVSLEEYLVNYRGSVLIVSHDRKLLDNVVNKILEIDPVNKTFKEYHGNYSAYLEQKQKNFVKETAEYERQQKEKKRIELWLAKKKEEARIYADPAKGKQIRAKEKYLEREIIAKEIKKPGSERKISSLNFVGDVNNSKLMFRFGKVSLSFPEKSILKNVSFDVRGKDRVLLSGMNGSGKTTLLKILLGKIKPDAGSVVIGNSIKIGYFSQEHEFLSKENTVLREFQLSPDVRSVMSNDNDARKLLGSFLFSGENVNKKVGDLSQGERVRLIFARLTQSDYQLLVLDEPTNHLDIASREVIENALNEYEGALVVVSHDRFFVDKVGFNRFLFVENGEVFEDFNV